MKGLVLSLLVIFGLSSPAWALDVGVAPVYRNSDNPDLEDGVGISIEAEEAIGDGLTAGLELNLVNQDIEIKTTKVGELSSTSVFGNIKYDVLEHKKVNLAVGGGLGFISPEVDSDIPSIDIDADPAIAFKAFGEWLWNIHKGQELGPWYKTADVNVFGQLAYVVADTDVEVSSDGSSTFIIEDQDLDSVDVKAGFKIKY